MSRQLWMVQRRGVRQGQLAHRSTEPNFVPYHPVRLFRDRDRAEAFRAELEKVARLTTCPFSLLLGSGEVHFGDHELYEWVVAYGLPEPHWVSARIGNRTLRHIDWEKWWRATLPICTDEQIDWVWGLFADVELVRVVSMSLDDPGTPA